MPTSAGYQTFDNRQGETRDFWEGTPRDAYDESCPIYQMLAKREGVTWEGGDGAPIAKLPYRYGLGGAGSANVQAAWYNSGTPTAMRWQLTPGRYYQSIAEDFDTHYLVDPGSNGQTDLWRHLMETCPKRFAKVQSVWWWGAGGGSFARGAGSGSAATGTTYTLKNSLCAAFFEGGLQEGQGDVIDFSATDGTQAGGTLRSVTRRITGVDRDAGTITLDTALDGSGVLDNDYVFLHGTYGQHTSKVGKPFAGIGAWNPLTRTEAITTLYGKDRSENPTKLAGLRLPTPVGADPWTVVLSILKKCAEQSAMINCLVLTPHMYAEMINSARPAALSVGGGQMLARNRSRSVAGSPSMYSNEAPSFSSPIKDDPIHMRYGANGVMVQFGGRNAWIYQSIYLSDQTVAKEADRIVRGLNIEDFATFMGKRMPGWLDPSGQGSKTWRQGTDITGAMYGAIGNYACRVPANTIVASPNASLS